MSEAPPGWLSGEYVRLLTWWLRVQSLGEATLFVFFRLSPLHKHVRKSSWWLWKEIYVSTGVRKPGNTCVTDCHDMTLAVKVALSLNTTNLLSEIRGEKILCKFSVKVHDIKLMSHIHLLKEDELCYHTTKF